MSLVLNLPPEAEKSLHEKAAQNGLAPHDYVLRLVISDVPPLDTMVQRPGRLSRNEGDILAQINQGIPVEIWARYDQLLQKRDMDSLSSDEHAELLVLSDTIEEKNAARIGHIAELARLRGTTLPDLMRELGIEPRKRSTTL